MRLEALDPAWVAISRWIRGDGTIYPHDLPNVSASRGSVVLQHPIRKLPPAGHLLILLAGEAISWFFDLVVALEEVRAHFQQALLVAVKGG